MLLLGIAASLWQARRAMAAEEKATTKAAAERVAREKSEAILKFITEVLQSPDPARDGSTITVAESLDQAAIRSNADLTNQPDVRATLQETLASAYNALGLPRQAIPLRENVRDYDIETLGLENTNTLDEMGALANSYFAAGRRDDAIKIMEQLLGLRRKVNGPEDFNTLLAMGTLANFYYAASHRDEATQDAGRCADA